MRRAASACAPPVAESVWRMSSFSVRSRSSVRSKESGSEGAALRRVSASIAINRHRFSFRRNREIFNSNLDFAGQNVSTLDQVLQFPQIAGKLISLQVLQRLRADVSPRHLEFGRDLPAEHLAKAGDVLTPIAQRRKMNGYHRQSVEKVFTEKSFPDALLEIAMSGDQNADIHFARTR